MTTPAARVRKIWAGWKPLPSNGLAATTGAFGSPAEAAGARTTTVFVEPVQPPGRRGDGKHQRAADDSGDQGKGSSRARTHRRAL